ncbi:MAG: helix-turn-helix transcriptional regulator [Candidatus Gastranaerophilales bacterium]|nr:helix-turn-helix transcriptional regulator [Candidatus Gastranaerophilales bacterium]
MGKKTFKLDKVLCRKFGERIRFLRNSHNLKQDELAFKAQISPSYLSAIERGISDTTISTAKRLAKAFNINLNDLFDF